MPHSLLNTNLQLLDSKLQALLDTAYFDQRILRYVDSLRAIIGKLTDPASTLDETVRVFVSHQVWSATEFIAGSAPRLQPYEIVYGLQCAVAEWFAAQRHGVKAPLIVTSLVQEANFYFKGIAQGFEEVLSNYLGMSIEYEIIQIKLPEVYRRKPLYTVALYHELGHFMDARFVIAQNVDILCPNLSLPGMSAPSAQPGFLERTQRLTHIKEYFADLFAACYCRSAIKRFLEGFIPTSLPSLTHPATHDRIQVVQALLEGKPHVLIDAFNLALKARAQPELQLRFDRPIVKSCFDAIRPAPIKSDAQVHGILDAAWEYLDTAAERNAEPWKSLSDLEIERVINDLVEKSIRNRMILEQWTHEAGKP
jgi:hypothetical protein